MPRMEKPMTPPSKFVVLFAILVLPSRLLGQVHETPKQPTAPLPVPAGAVSPHQAGTHAEELPHGQSCWAAFNCTGESPACHTPRQSVFIFGGHLTKRSMGDTADVFNVTYD